MSKSLRVAGYARTSSERQRDNTSIGSQKEAITKFATVNDWTVVSFYVDEAKSGSKIDGREEFQRMFREAATGSFDVVVIADITRFGRSGMDILESARTLSREFGVPVLDTKGQFDTRDQSKVLSNFIFAGVSENERLAILGRTKKGKVKRAQEGRPIGVQRPYGRNWVITDRRKKEGHWEIDPVKQKTIAEIAARYLRGESLPAMAKEYRISHAALCRTLRERCGSVWVQHVRCRELGIDETVETAVPELLDAQTAKALRERLAANRSYLHRPPVSVYNYLLCSRVFCSACGSCFYGDAKREGRRYYRHSKKVPCSITPLPWVPAGDIEQAVLGDLFNMFGSPAHIERAVKASLPDVSDGRKRQAKVNDELEKVRKARSRILALVEKDDITDDQASARLRELKAKENTLKVDLANIEAALAHVPDETQLKVYVERIVRPNSVSVIVHNGQDELPGGNSVGTFLMMNYQDKKALIDSAFNGPHVNGRPNGVYITPTSSKGTPGKKRGFVYELQGRLAFGVVPRPLCLQETPHSSIGFRLDGTLGRER